ncbi:amino acid decarboxylase [cyanobiont of Ornithocercus magnificus]|nr:amino acid decarboxylase [cyanobiont of Ornithocercus magnificus]
MISPFVLGVSGASAQQLAERALQQLLRNGCDVHLIMSRGAYKVWRAERALAVPTDPERQSMFWRDRLDESGGTLTCHHWNNQSAVVASGSFRTAAMAVIPCSMGTIGRIRAGIASDLIERCADVHLKERRPLLLAPRETPFNLIHLRNLTELAEAGATIAPPIPAWYTDPKSIDDMVDFMVVRMFDSLGETLKPLKRWHGGVL